MGQAGRPDLRFYRFISNRGRLTGKLEDFILPVFRKLNPEDQPQILVFDAPERSESEIALLDGEYESRKADDEKAVAFDAAVGHPPLYSLCLAM